jgi:hypothetical protein
MSMARTLRYLGGFCVIALILWLPIEDTQVWLSAALALMICLWIGLSLFASRFRFAHGLALVALGALLGAAAPLLAISLMAFKSGLHGHGFADFTARQVWAMWSAIPFSFLIGGLLAVPLHLFVARWGKSLP